jgi:hypothetical protein
MLQRQPKKSAAVLLIWLEKQPELQVMQPVVWLALQVMQPVVLLALQKMQLAVLLALQKMQLAVLSKALAMQLVVWLAQPVTR